MGQQHDDIPPGRLLSLGPRPAAVARGEERLRRGPVPPDALAAAMLQAHAMLRGLPTGRAGDGRPYTSASEWACGSVVASRSQSQAKRPT
jgi:hypothetical protein